MSAGGTREPIDLVRYVGNRSSGRMGVALAAEASKRGGDVTLVYANGSVPAPEGLEVVPAPTAADMKREMLARADADVIVMAAAVPTTGPANRMGASARKARSHGRSPSSRPRTSSRSWAAGAGTDRCWLGSQPTRGTPASRARAKLANKGGNLFVFNDVSRPGVGFDAPDNDIVLISPRGERRIGRRSKEECAVAILDEVETLLKGA